MGSTRRPPDLDGLFSPLTQQERERAGQARSTSASGDDVDWQSHPVPADQVPGFMHIKHREFGAPDTAFWYRNQDGNITHLMLRWEADETCGRASKEMRPYTSGTLRVRASAGGEVIAERKGWHYKAPCPPYVLFNLPELVRRPDAPVLVCEGEKSAHEAAAKIPTHVCVTSCFGSNGLHKTDWQPLANRSVTIWPDNDAAGQQYASSVAGKLIEVGATSVAIVDVPSEFGRGWDLADDPPNGVDGAALLRMVESALPVARTASDADPNPTTARMEPASATGTRNVEIGSAVIQAVSGTATPTPLPHLLVDDSNLPAVAASLAMHLRSVDNLYDRASPCELVTDPLTGLPTAHHLDHNGIVRICHAVCMPVKIADGKMRVVTGVTLSDRAAKIYLSNPGGWGLRPLHGITTGIVFRDDGAIVASTGYDPETGLYCVGEEGLEVPESPTDADAAAALLTLRSAVRTFAFKGAQMTRVEGIPTPVVDMTTAPGAGESAYMSVLLMAVARPSLQLAPGAIFRAPNISGSGAGKGLLVRTACIIAYGVEPHAITAGHSEAELDKRVTALLLAGDQTLFIDNVNARVLDCDTLASATTETHTSVRPLGRSDVVRIRSRSFVALTGNGLTLSGDLVRRFIPVDIDPGMEMPSTRQFRGDHLSTVRQNRKVLLAAALTILRWGRQKGSSLPEGQPMGSYSQWARWCRDPLLALGCADPALCIHEAAAHDPQRDITTELLSKWHEKHGSAQVASSELHLAVHDVLARVTRSRQDVANYLAQMDGTRCGGYVFMQIPKRSRNGVHKYKVERVEENQNPTPAAPQPTEVTQGRSDPNKGEGAGLAGATANLDVEEDPLAELLERF
jgi:hypothetical protein